MPPTRRHALNAAALNPHGHPTSNFLVIGSEGGFLQTPAFVPSDAPCDGTTGGSLLLAPGKPRNHTVFIPSPCITVATGMSSRYLATSRGNEGIARAWRV